MLRGEWRGAPGRNRAQMITGVLVLALAFVVLDKANQRLG
jgi:hypothetical protein